MTAIWFILATMTGAAVLALLWPMSRRANPVAASLAPEAGALATETGFYEDQLSEIERDLGRGLIAPTEAEAARAEAARRLLRANRQSPTVAASGMAEPALRQRRAASAFALSTIPLVALIAYGLYGSPHLPAQTAAERQAAQSGEQDVVKAVGQIEARLAADPTDGRGWSVLAPVYMRMARFDDAARAYEAATRILGETPERLSDWGEAMVAAANGAIAPEARKVFERAVALDGDAPKPRFYLARAAELDGDVPGAIARLAAMVETGPADAAWLPLVRENLARLKGEPSPATGETGPATGSAAELQALPPQARDAAIRGMVESLDQRLSARGGTAEEWLRLVRSQSVLGDRDKAQAAFARGRTALAGDAGAVKRLDDLATELGLATAATGPAEPETGRAEAEAVAAVKAMPAPERDAAIRGMVRGLDQRLAAKGGTLDEWLRLVRSYSVLGERRQADEALGRAKMALGPDAEALARLDGLATELGLRAAEARSR
jgi:cytochrome c-type biogenesis protein CcmI